MQRESYICALAVAKKTAPKKKDAFIQAINKKETEIADYRSISRSPFMLFAIFSTYVKGQELPDNRFDAICRIIDDIIRRDLERNGYDMFDSKNIKEILGAVSCTFNRQRDDGITPHLNSDAPFNCAKEIYQLDDSDSYDRKLINKYREFFSHNDLLDENGFRHEFLAATYAAYYLFFLMKRKGRKGNSPIEVKEISSLKKNTDYWKSVSEALLCLLDRESEDSKTYIEPLLEEMQKEETLDYDLLCKAVSQFTTHQSRAAGMLLSRMLDRGCIGILTGKQTHEKFIYQKGVNPYEELFYYPAVYPYLQQYLPNLTSGENQGQEFYLCSELIKEVCALFSDNPEENLHNVYSGRVGNGYEEINSRMGDTAYKFGHKIKGYVMVNITNHQNQSRFYFCNELTNIALTQNANDIFFEKCYSLLGIIVDQKNMVYSSSNGVLFNKDRSKLIRYPPGKTGAYTIPDGVRIIDTRAFESCRGLTNITIPDSVTEIGKLAFVSCAGLTYIRIPDSITKIGSDSFSGCTNLTSITISNNITQISEFTFNSCISLTSITIPDSVTEIGSSAFSGCANLANITIPNSVTKIGPRAFQGCINLSSITIPANVTIIGYRAFDGCPNLTIHAPKGSFAEAYAKENEIPFVEL